MKFFLSILITLIAFTVSTKWWGYPWGGYYYGGYWPMMYGGYYYPYFYFFKDANDAPKDVPFMFKLPDNLDDMCSKNATKGNVCGLDKDKKIVGDFDSLCDAGKNDSVDFVLCGKCPDKEEIKDKAFDFPMGEGLPTCTALNTDDSTTRNLSSDDTKNNSTDTNEPKEDENDANDENEELDDDDN